MTRFSVLDLVPVRRLRDDGPKEESAEGQRAGKGDAARADGHADHRFVSP